MLLFPVLEGAAAAAESLRRATPTRVMFPIRAPPLTKNLLRPFIQECHKVGNPPLHRVQAAFGDMLRDLRPTTLYLDRDTAR